MQIKGDPSIRGFLFQQQRVESLFDPHIDRIHNIVHTLLIRKGVFHAKIHYSSSQLTCWFAHDPSCYEKFLREEVFDDGFLDRFPEADYEGHSSVLESQDIERIVEEFKRLRLTDQTIYLRNGSVNLINGMFNMGFSCDGTYYIDYKSFIARLDTFETTDCRHETGEVLQAIGT